LKFRKIRIIKVKSYKIRKFTSQEWRRMEIVNFLPITGGLHQFQELISNQVIFCKANGTHNFFRLTATKILIGSSRLDGMHWME